MASHNNLYVPEDLLAEIEAKASEQGRTVADVAESAFRAYLDKENWASLVESKRAAARDRGLTEHDVPRLIEESRRERHHR